MAAITKIEVAGFRSLKHVELVPGAVTVLIGANGSGKSNLLSLLQMVPLMRSQSLRRFVGEAGGASALLHYGPKVTREIEVRLEFEQETSRSGYQARLGYAAGDSLIYLDEAVQDLPGAVGGFGQHSLGAGHAESRLKDEGADPRSRRVNWWLSRMGFFHFHDTSREAPLRQNARQADIRYLRSNGSNLAAYLRALAQGEAPSYRAAWARITGLIKRVAPFIKTLEPTLVDPTKPETSNVRLDWIDERDEVFGPHQLSDGTLRAVALFTALAQPRENLPAFVSIDEPELGLHPAAVEILASLIRSITTHCQVLLATQSPAILDFLQPSEVVVAERASGETQLRRLNQGELEGWLAEYSLSELYGKNVLGGRP